MSRLTLGLTSPDYFFSDLQDALKRAVDDNSEKLYVTNEGGNIFLLNDPLFELPTAEQCPAVLIDCDEGEAVIDAEEYAPYNYFYPVSLIIIHNQEAYPDINPQRFLDRLRLRTVNNLTEPDAAAPGSGIVYSTNPNWTGDGVTPLPWWHWDTRKGNRRHELCYDFKNRRRSFQLKPQFHGQRVYLPDAYVYQWLNEEGMTVR
jgi:hypothetical protein